MRDLTGKEQMRIQTEELQVGDVICNWSATDDSATVVAKPEITTRAVIVRTDGNPGWARFQRRRTISIWRDSEPSDPSEPRGDDRTQEMTPEQVEALPDGTVALWPHDGAVFVHCEPDDGGGWLAAGSHVVFPSKHVASHPLIIVWEPPVQKPEPVWRQIIPESEGTTDCLINGVPGRYFRTLHWAVFAGTPNRSSHAAFPLDKIETVEPLHTYDPSTHALIEIQAVNTARQRVNSWSRDLGYPGSSAVDGELIRLLAELKIGEES